MEVRLILVATGILEEHAWLLQYSHRVEDGNTHTQLKLPGKTYTKTIEQVTTQMTIHARGEEEYKTWTCSSNILQRAL